MMHTPMYENALYRSNHQIISTNAHRILSYHLIYVTMGINIFAVQSLNCSLILKLFQANHGVFIRWFLSQGCVHFGCAPMVCVSSGVIVHFDFLKAIVKSRGSNNA